MPYTPVPAHVQVLPADPATTTSATYVDMGLGVAGANAFTLTPTVTGRVLVLISGNISSTTTAMTLTTELIYGTGTAPANGTAIGASSTAGPQIVFVTLTGALKVPFALQAVITGLAVPTINSSGLTTSTTPVWFDLVLKTSGANAAALTALSCTAIEI